MVEQRVAADLMARMIADDPQLQVPTRPRQVSGLEVIELDDGLLVEGGPERQVFRGGAATTVLPRLLAMLDGTASVDEIASRFEALAPEQVASALALLYTRGLLEDGGGDGDGAVATFLSRIGDTTRANRNGDQAVARLADATVVLVGGPCHQMVVDDLEDTGVGAVDHVDRWGAVTVDGVSLVIADARRDDTGRLLDDCATAGVHYLHAAIAGDVVEVGPLVVPGQPSCLRCLRRHLDDDVQPEPLDAALRSAFAGGVVAEAVHLLSRTVSLRTLGSMLRLDVGAWSQEQHLVTRSSACEDCGRSDVDIPAYRYEQAIEFPPAQLLDPKEHQAHYELSNLAKQRAPRRLPPVPDLELTPPDQLPRADGGRAARMDEPTMSALLLRTVGLREAPGRGTKLQRWAPTGGNLGSPQAVLIAKDVAGLEPGAYAYRGLRHRVAVLRQDRAATPGVPGTATEAPAVVVLTAALDRVAEKYGPLAYRIVHLDAGCALTQMSWAASGLGLAALPEPWWDDEALAGHLGIDLEREPITAVVRVDLAEQVERDG